MPEWRAIVRARLAAFTLPPTTEIDVTEEIVQHLEDRYEQLRADGLSDDEALVRTQAELDGSSLVEELRDVFGRG